MDLTWFVFILKLMFWINSLLKYLFLSLEFGQHIIEDVEEKVNMVFLKNQRWSEANWSIPTSTQKDTCQKQKYNIGIYAVYVIQLDNTTGYDLCFFSQDPSSPE